MQGRSSNSIQEMSREEKARFWVEKLQKELLNQLHKSRTAVTALNWNVLEEDSDIIFILNEMQKNAKLCLAIAKELDQAFPDATETLKLQIRTRDTFESIQTYVQEIVQVEFDYHNLKFSREQELEKEINHLRQEWQITKAKIEEKDKLIQQLSGEQREQNEEIEKLRRQLEELREKLPEEKTKTSEEKTETSMDEEESASAHEEIQSCIEGINTYLALRATQTRRSKFLSFFFGYSEADYLKRNNDWGNLKLVLADKAATYEETQQYLSTISASYKKGRYKAHIEALKIIIGRHYAKTPGDWQKYVCAEKLDVNLSQRQPDRFTG